MQIIVVLISQSHHIATKDKDTRSMPGSANMQRRNTRTHPQQRCDYCSQYRYVSSNQCRARGRKCNNCGKLDHFPRVCCAAKISRWEISSSSHIQKEKTSKSVHLTSINSSSLEKNIIMVKLNKFTLPVLVDTGASISCITKHRLPPRWV